jgi:L-aminopeptidase/D-esterase-like protein
MRALCLAGIWLVDSALAAGSAAVPPAPTPNVSFDGPALNFEFPGVQIGVAEYEEGPTGATVIYFDKTVKAAVDVRGGAPGTVNTDALRLGYDEPLVHAITLAGGSAYGLSVATGVADAIKETLADAGNWRNIAVVPGAIIFDLGGRRYNAITPDERLGRAAFSSLRSGWIPVGARGAGRFAMQGGYFGEPQHSGQGAAFRESGATKVLVVTVVNAVGTIVDREGRIVRCGHSTETDCGLVTRRLQERLSRTAMTPPAAASADTRRAGLTANTTVTLVITNQVLPISELQRLAVQVHNSMARAIQPFGTQYDGDTLFAVTTGAVKDRSLGSPDLGVLASETAWDAVLASVPALPERTQRTNPELSPSALDRAVGRYEFAPGIVAALRRQGAGLEIEATGAESQYLKAGRATALTAVAIDEFELSGPREDRLRIDRGRDGRVIGITLNPGPWAVKARRLP